MFFLYKQQNFHRECQRDKQFVTSFGEFIHDHAGRLNYVDILINLFSCLFCLQKIKHPSSFEKYKTEVNDHTRKDLSRKRKRQESLPRLNPLGFKPVSKSSKKQQEFDNDIVDYIIDSMKPFSTVEQKSFIKLFNCAPDVKVMSRSTLMRRIEDKKQKDFNETVSELAKVDVVCTMADIWSTKHHGYLGVSTHWIDDQLVRRGRVLACKNFKNPHTAERIAEELYMIHNDHGLPVRKIVSTITDNASNMVKAFRDFGVQIENSDEDEIISEENDVMSETEFEAQAEVFLPKHQRFEYFFNIL